MLQAQILDYLPIGMEGMVFGVIVVAQNEREFLHYGPCKNKLF